MCRTGGRRCRGNDGKHKARLRKRISRARTAITDARAVGDLDAAARAESRLAEARADLAALNAEHAATGGDVTPDDQHDQHVTVVTISSGVNAGVQTAVITDGVEISGRGIRIGGQPITTHEGDATTPHDDEPTTRQTTIHSDNQPVIIKGPFYVDTFQTGTTFHSGPAAEETPDQPTHANHRHNYGVQAAVITGDIVYTRRHHDVPDQTPSRKSPDRQREAIAPAAEPYVPRANTEPRPPAVTDNHAQAVADATAAQDALRRFERMRRKFPRPGR